MSNESKVAKDQRIRAKNMHKSQNIIMSPLKQLFVAKATEIMIYLI